MASFRNATHMKLSNVMHCACPTCTARHTAAGCDPIRLPIWSYGSIRASLPRAASMHHSSYYYPTLDTHNTHVLFLGCACYGDLNIPLNHDLIASTVLATPAARRRRPLWRTGFDHIYIYMYIYIYIYTYIHTCMCNIDIYLSLSIHTYIYIYILYIYIYREREREIMYGFY